MEGDIFVAISTFGRSTCWGEGVDPIQNPPSVCIAISDNRAARIPATDFASVVYGAKSRRKLRSTTVNSGGCCLWKRSFLKTDIFRVTVQIKTNYFLEGSQMWRTNIPPSKTPIGLNWNSFLPNQGRLLSGEGNQCTGIVARADKSCRHRRETDRRQCLNPISRGRHHFWLWSR